MIILSTILFIIQFLDYREENARMLDLINQYESTRFIPALSHLNGLEKRIGTWIHIQLLRKEEIDYELENIQKDTQVFQEIVEDHNKIFTDSVPLPNNLLNWLQQVRVQFLDLKNKSTTSTIQLSEKDLVTFLELQKKLKKINTISKNIFNVDSGLTSLEWDKMMQKGFLNDPRWLRWLQQVEKSLLP